MLRGCGGGLHGRSSDVRCGWSCLSKLNNGLSGGHPCLGHWPSLCRRRPWHTWRWCRSEDEVLRLRGTLRGQLGLLLTLLLALPAIWVHLGNPWHHRLWLLLAVPGGVLPILSILPLRGIVLHGGTKEVKAVFPRDREVFEPSLGPNRDQLAEAEMATVVPATIVSMFGVLRAGGQGG